MAKDTPADVWENPFSAPPEEIDPEPEPKPSMSMTKAELLERVEKLEAERDAARAEANEALTKAELIEHAKEVEAETAALKDPDAALVSQSTLAAMPGVVAPLSDEVCTATINGQSYSWTAATADQVPEEALAVWARYKQANP